jgi:hypothetical protein
VYIVGVTWFARREAVASRAASLMGAVAVINVGLSTLFGWVAETSAAWPGSLLLAVIALTINRSALAAIAWSSPQSVQVAVRTMLLSIITLDAALIFVHTGNILLAATIAVSLLLPAAFLGRLIRIT